MARRDPSFNEFLKNFKAKNEQNWASIIDMTQEDQEEQLLAKTPQYRENEMIMLEEFRRRKMHKDFYDIKIKETRDQANRDNITDPILDKLTPQTLAKFKEKQSAGPERHFEPAKDEIFNPRDFTLIFVDSDSVTNVTTLNRINQRRVLIFAGNGNGIISYGKGKGEDYEKAFDNAFKFMRTNLVCLSLD